MQAWWICAKLEAVKQQKTTKHVTRYRMKIYLTSVVAALAITAAAPAVQLRAQDSEIGATGDAETPEIEWIEVNLEAAGTLGVEILYKVDKLSDVQNLRVSGPLNDQDWATMKNMNAVNIDLSGATATSIPTENFYGKSYMQSFLFPQGVRTVGERCFCQTAVKEITIPETVTSVGKNCFERCNSLESVEWNGPVNIPENCFSQCKNLTSVTIAEGAYMIGSYGFYSCDKISHLNLPSTLRQIGSNAFSGCSSLAEVSLPDGLQSIGQNAFNSCGLTKVVVPDSVTGLGSYVFSSNNQLTEVTLPAGIFAYGNYEFSGCPNITKVTCRTATPPAIITGNYNYPPFVTSIMSKCTLSVPDFAVVDYKLHDYWHSFATIEGGVQADSWTLTSALSLTNDRRMDGTPSITLASGGMLTVGGSAPMPMNDFSVHANLRDRNQPCYGQLINNSPAMTANSGSIRIFTYYNTWYFITMPCDVKMSAVSHSAGASFVFRYYDGESRAANGTGGSWKNVPADGTLEAGKAYIYQCSGEGNIVMELDGGGIEGILGNAHRVTPVNAWASEYAAHSGWNLIGNPWLSYFDLSYTGLTCPVTLWDENYSKYVAYSLIDDDVVLRPMQAFFMQQADADSEITFDLKGRQFTAQVSRPAGARANAAAAAAGRSVFNVEIKGKNGESTDRMRVVLNDSASDAYETACDAAKFFSDNGQCAELFSIDGEGNYLAINERPATTENIPVGVYAPEAGMFTIHATRADGKAQLYDSKTGRYTDLAAGEEYTFEAAGQGYILDRFHLILSPALTGVDTIGCGQNPMTEIYTLDGFKVAEGAELGNGVYIVKEGGKITKKIVK